jgi:PAS domain S-box-containing protein
LDSSTNGNFSFSHESLQRDFELLTKAVDASISGVVITDNQQPDNPIIFCNAAFEKMTGYTRNEIIGRNCRFLQKEDRTQKEREILQDAIREGKNSVVEIRNYTKTGSLFWNELYLSPVKDEKGNVTYFIGVQHDVTQRKKAEQDLKQEQESLERKVEERTRIIRESEEYLSSIYQTVRESLIVLNPEFKVVSVNDYFLRTFKVSAAETEGQLLYNLGNGQWNIPKLKELLEQILPTNNPVENFEVEHNFPQIGRKIMLFNAYRIELEGQYKDRILIAVEDITNQREIERRKDDFLSIASHELKTPLTTIKGYVQMMERFMPNAADEKFKNIVKKTGAYVERLNSLIGELLDVSRIQTGKIELHKEPFDFDKMLRDTVDGMQAANKEFDIEISGTSVNNYVGDELQLVQVINNLLSNAIKYSPNTHKVLVHASLVSDFLKVSVTDYGMGISIEDQKNIFERFYRVGDIQQHFPGMGIGLYVCDQVIKKHGGTIWVESEKGRGSTFSFTLPLNERKNDE